METKNLFNDLDDFFHKKSDTSIFFHELEETYKSLDFRKVKKSKNLESVIVDLDTYLSHVKNVLETKSISLSKEDPLISSISLFGVLDYGRLEKAHTKFLAWLLDPTGNHGFDRIILDCFLSCLEISPKDFDCLKVKAESITDEYKFIDILINGKINGAGVVIAIEAKIDACESENQLDNYDQYLSQYIDHHIFKVVLAPGGFQIKTGNRNNEKWRLLTFFKLAKELRITFLKDLNPRMEGYYIFRHYLTCLLKDLLQIPIPFNSPMNIKDKITYESFMAFEEK